MKKKILIPLIIVATCAIGVGGYSIKKMNEPKPQIIKPITTASATPAAKATPIKVVATTTPKKVEETKNSTSTPTTKVKEIKHETTKSVEPKHEQTHHVEKSKPKKEVEHHSESNNKPENTEKQVSHEKKKDVDSKPTHHSGEYGTPEGAIQILKNYLGSNADKYDYVVQKGKDEYFVSTRLKGKHYEAHMVDNTYVVQATYPRVQEVG